MKWYILLFTLVSMGVVSAQNGSLGNWPRVLLLVWVVASLVALYSLFLLLYTHHSHKGIHSHVKKVLGKKKKKLDEETGEEVQQSLVAAKKKGFSLGRFLRRETDKDIEEEKIRGAVDDLLRENEANKLDHDSLHEDMYKLHDDFRQNVDPVLNEEVKRVLRITDKLLGKLSESEIEDFVSSSEFDNYKKVMRKVYRPLRPDLDALNKFEKVLVLLERKIITIEEARKMLHLPAKNISQKKVQPLSEKDSL
jgi:hypothetical protein